MLHILLTLIILNLLAAMSPGPDFAIVTQNTLMHSRRAGVLTAFGICCSMLIHVAYCILGLAVVIRHAHWLFDVISIVGGLYLMYLGFGALRAKMEKSLLPDQVYAKTPKANFAAFKNGFLTNLLNPKCILFFVALFTYVPIQHMNVFFGLLIEACLFVTVFAWFSSLSYLLSHRILEKRLEKLTPYIVKVTGVALFAIGIVLIIGGVS